MDLLITSGCGNIIQGGADIWTNHFLELVYPIIKKDKEYKVLVDGRKPIGWDSNYFEDIDITFYREDRERSLELLKSSEQIHFLHTPYFDKDYLMDFKEKFGVIFVHAYPRDMLNVDVGGRLQINTAIDPDGYDRLLSYGKKLVWIGIDKDSSVYDKFNPDNIPNFYEFKHNIPFQKKINPTIGFTSRIESRKNVGYMDGKKGYVLTDKRGWTNFKDMNHIDDSKIKFYQWSAENLDPFMRKTWSVSHSCHHNEPFGYSIFQAVDYGKLPIINTYWGKQLSYKYRANTKIGFNMCFFELQNDSHEIAEEEFNNLKKFMKQFDNKNTWISRIVGAMNVKNVKVYTF